MKVFSDKIIRWYHQNKRDLPWRNTQNPYFIWLSEIIMQQTRVEQGMPYYLAFVKAFPAVKYLAKAPNDRIMKMWQGLGYYSRARNLHTTAKIIQEKHNGVFPKSFDEVIKLKGIGEYTAAAIVSFAYNQPHAVVDGNVYRVLARVFGIKTPIDSSKGKKDFLKLANELIDKKNAGIYNQAIMEFGAIQCKPLNPNCSNCVLQAMCYAFETKQINELPIKEKKTKVRNRYFNYVVLKNKNETLIKKRTEKDIWVNLFDFPLIETAKKISLDDFFNSAEWEKMIGKNKYVVKKVSGEYKHILSHQKIFACFYEVEVSASLSKIKINNGLVVPIKSLSKQAVPRLIDKFLEENQL